MSAPASDWYRASAEGITLHLRVTPNAGRDRIEGPELRDDGSMVLRVRVKAVPDKGKANAAVMVLIAGALGVAKSEITLVSGETSRLKILSIAGDRETLIRRASLL